MNVFYKKEFKLNLLMTFKTSKVLKEILGPTRVLVSTKIKLVLQISEISLQ